MDKLITAFLCAMSISASAGTLPVLADHGGLPIEVVLQQVLPKEEKTTFTRPTKAQQEAAIQTTLNFPMQSPAKPGEFLSRDFEEPLNSLYRPIALVGCDNLSVQWLKAYSLKLKELGAVVFVISCVDSLSYKKVASIYANTMPYNGDRFFKELNIATYPVLVTRDGVYQ